MEISMGREISGVLPTFCVRLFPHMAQFVWALLCVAVVSLDLPAEAMWV